MLRFSSIQNFISISLFLFSMNSLAKPAFSKIMIVVLENTDFEVAARQTFLNELAKSGARLDNMTAATHPSQGNYISLIAGDLFGVTNDNNIDLDGKHIGDLLEAKGLTWKVYAENYPGNCFLGATSAGTYARKHVPFLSFKNVTKDKKRCANIVNATQLTQDIKSGSLPNYSLYIPNLKNDGHDTGVSYADHYLSVTFGKLLKDKSFMDNLLFIVTFDESVSRTNNHIYTSLYGDSVIAGSTSNVAYTHYSILKTIESIFNLGQLGKQDSSASEILDVLKQ